MKLKTKLIISLGFLFLIILLFGILGIFYISRLSNDTNNIIKDNYETLVYNNNMLKSLEELSENNTNALHNFETNLKKQEEHLTEQEEKNLTESVRKNYELLKKNPLNPSNYKEIRKSIQLINNETQNAISRKNGIAEESAKDATFWLTIIFSIFSLLAFTMVFNIPNIIATPISALAEGIREIANKNYSKRIYLNQHDEFGELAETFNIMAGKLDEYEHSNLAKIKFEKRRIETIINQMRDGIIGLDENKNVLFLNAVAQNLLGLEEKDIVGKYAADIAVINDLMRTLLQSSSPITELKIYADHKESYFNKDVFNVINNDLIIGQVIVLRNITPFHELNEAKTNFIATVSHELKTPLSSIKMSAKLLTDNRIGNLNTEQHELLKSITEDANRLLKITGELLNMSQVETGNIQLKIQPVVAQEIVEEAIQAVQIQAQEKGISIQPIIQENLPSVQADKEKTSWVLINLLTNAIKYSPEQSSIDVEVYQLHNTVCFKVQDQGKGIEEQYLHKIFDRYFKIPGLDQQSGTGLGLSICKEFIEAQGGTIDVKSILGQGSAFYFALAAI